jgi:hypothetical protein
MRKLRQTALIAATALLALTSGSTWAIDLEKANALPIRLPATSEALPSDLSFSGKRLRVFNPNWFFTLFGPQACEEQLSSEELQFRVRALGEHSIEMSFAGKPSKWISSAKANYIPLYFEANQPRHPHFDLRIPNWVHFKMIISTVAEGKELSVWLVHDKPGTTPWLEPIFFVSEY